MSVLFDGGVGGGEAAPATFYTYPVNDSLRLNDDDSAYLSRTPASAGNRKTFTWSGWVKRGNLGSANLFNSYLFNNAVDYLSFVSTDVLRILWTNGSWNNFPFLETASVFRDVGGWYHVVLSVDTTQATSTDRIKLFVNGIQQTLSGTFPSQDYQFLAWNTTKQHLVGAGGASSGYTGYLDGYFSEIHFCDGTAYTASDFGEFKSGVWIPKTFAGSYGTNGFYLDFADNSTAAALGTDQSGNGNDWTVNNISTYDQMLDTPTNNFCTLNPLCINNFQLETQGNLASAGNSSVDGTTLANAALPKTGKWYWEVYTGTFVSVVQANDMIGIATKNYDPDSYLGFSSSEWSYYANGGNKYNGGSNSAYGSSFNTGAVVSVLWDADARDLKFWNAGSDQGTAFSGLAEDEYFPAFGEGANVGYTNFVVNFGQDSSFAGNKTRQNNADDNGYGDFYYTPPSGYLALCSANLPEPTISPLNDDIPADYFDVVLDTGANIKTASEALFTNQFAWIKDRANVNNHQLIDSVRGTSAVLQSNTTGVEAAYSTPSGSSVAWVWDCVSTGSSNTDGSITSTVAANTTSGFSIVSYNGNFTDSTVGHGLSIAPELIIVRNRDVVRNWGVYAEYSNGGSGEGGRLLLESTGAFLSDTLMWQNTKPTSSVFYVGQRTTVNESGAAHIAYCFHSIEGYSKIGSFEGNGSTDGPFVYTGFRPAFVMIKVSSGTTASWYMFDRHRNTYNIVNARLMANVSDVESTSIDALDFMSNGFKIRDTNAAWNGSGNTYIYMAFAEMPFKYANAR